MLPLVVVEGPQAAVDDARGELAARGWDAVEVVIEDERSAAVAVLAALEGRPVLAVAAADREVVDRLCDDLRRLGELDHRVDPDPSVLLTCEQHALMSLLASGHSLGEAAERLHLSRRSADRRLAGARSALRSVTTSAAVAAYARRTARVPAAPDHPRG